MNKKILFKPIIILAIITLLASCKKDHQPCDCKNGGVPTVKIFAKGFNGPRGLRFGPDGNLYVAEAGTGGTISTVGNCLQVPFPVGPYLGSPTGGRVSMVNQAGVRTIVTDQLPSSQANEIIGGDREGVSDVEFIGHNLYALLAGAGCSHGVASIPNQVVKINSNGTWSSVANISEYLMSHPVAHPEPDDFEPDGTPYSMINVDGHLYVLEPNHGDFMKINLGGQINRVADISASQGHIVPTTVAYREGNFVIGNLHPFPVVPGSSSLYRVTMNGQVSVLLTGFTTILGVTFDEDGRLYVLENSTVAGRGPTPGTGDIVRIDASGKKTVLVTGLSLPTAMTFGPDNKLYVSNMGFGPGADGGGQILQIDLQHCVPASATTKN